MFERIRDAASALKIDVQMGQLVESSGIPAKLSGEDWGDECMTVATARRTGAITPLGNNTLSPAARVLLPKKLVIN